MKIEISPEHFNKELTLRLIPENDTEKQLLDLVVRGSKVVQWHDGILGLSTKYRMFEDPT